MKYNKLVRDKIPLIIKNRRSIPITHIASNNEYWQKLKEKLQEEIDEFIKDENDEELAGILEVIYVICDYKSINKEKLELFKKEKVKEKGRFKEKIILDEIN